MARFLGRRVGNARAHLREWSLLGTATWATTFTLVGYLFSSSFGAATDVVTHSMFGLAVVAGLVLALRAHRVQRSVA